MLNVRYAIIVSPRFFNLLTVLFGSVLTNYGNFKVMGPRTVPRVSWPMIFSKYISLSSFVTSEWSPPIDSVLSSIPDSDSEPSSARTHSCIDISLKSTNLRTVKPFQLITRPNPKTSNPKTSNPKTASVKPLITYFC